MEELVQYILTNKVTAGRLFAETTDAENRLIPHRDLFFQLKQYADGFHERNEQPRLIALAGLRGVGKTTLVWQTAKHIFEKHTQEIFSLNADDLTRLGFRLYDVINAFERNIFEKPLHEIDHPVIFLIDEVHEVEGWDKDLKILYERCKRAFILCTGSSALLLHHSQDLASRWSLIRSYPFSFTEFLHSKSWIEQKKKELSANIDLDKTLKQILFFSDHIETLEKGLKQQLKHIDHYFEIAQGMFRDQSTDSLIDEYINDYNIARFLSIKNKTLITERIIDLFDRILLKDIPIISKTGTNDSELMFRLLLRLALSDEVNLEKLSSSIGCKRSQTEHLTETLNKAEILNIFNPYGGAKLKTGTLKKPFFMSPSLRRALFQKVYGVNMDERIRAKLFEDVIAMYLRRIFPEQGLLSFGYSADGVSPDFVIETGDHPVVLEAGSNKQSTKQIEKYHKQKRYGIIISASANGLVRNNNTLIIPLKWFLLL
jgi:predicted AAA+ superfamily ATPase